MKATSPFLFLTVALLAAAPAAHATERTFLIFTGGTHNWNDSAHWEGGGLPQIGDDLYFSKGTNAIGSSNNNLAEGMSFRHIIYNSTRAMTVNGNGIKLSGDITNLTTNNALTLAISIELLAGDHLVTTNSTSSNGTAIGTASTVLSGVGSLTLNGSGLFRIFGTGNTFSGGITVNSGTLRAMSGGTSLGTGTVTLNSGAFLSFNGGTYDIRGLTGSGTIRNDHVSSTANVNINTSAIGDTFSGLIEDSGARLSLTKSGVGTQKLTNTANTYSGATLIEGGVLEITKIANGGQNSSIGTSDSTTNNLSINGGTLRYTGSGDSTDRGVRVFDGGATLDASGTGAVAFTNTAALHLDGVNHTARTITFTGSNTDANTFAAVIGNRGSGATTIVKNGEGTWVLTGANTYTGGTFINEGELRINGQTNTAVSVASGATLGGHGKVGTISGAGEVGPGNSPGILTAESVNVSLGLDFTFEFTQIGAPIFSNAAASGNDLLRLTGGAPFSMELTEDNLITLDFTALSLAYGNTFQGGFFSDSVDLSAALANASFQYLGVGGFTVEMSVVSQLANFGGGDVNGYITQFTVVPEPGSVILLGSTAAAFGVAALRRRKRPL